MFEVVGLRGPVGTGFGVEGVRVGFGTTGMGFGTWIEELRWLSNATRSTKLQVHLLQRKAGGRRDCGAKWLVATEC